MLRLEDWVCNMWHYFLHSLLLWFFFWFDFDCDFFLFGVICCAQSWMQERYTCPCLALHPDGECFVAQTNGNYIAIFSSQRPYHINKRRRYEGHKVRYSVAQCQGWGDGIGTQRSTYRPQSHLKWNSDPGIMLIAVWAPNSSTASSK